MLFSLLLKGDNVLLLQALADASIIPSDLAPTAADLAGVWENHVLPFFAVSIPAVQIPSLLAAYSANISIPVPESTSNNTTLDYYALALNDDGTPVPVMHSDIGFTLLYGNNVPANVISSVPVLMTDFPRGLLTGVGMVVANPAYSDGGEFYANFTTGDYHGTVVWSFQQALMAAGWPLKAAADLQLNIIPQWHNGGPTYFGRCTTHAWPLTYTYVETVTTHLLFLHSLATCCCCCCCAAKQSSCFASRGTIVVPCA